MTRLDRLLRCSGCVLVALFLSGARGSKGGTTDRINEANSVRVVDVSSAKSRPGDRSAIVFCGTQGIPTHGFLIFEREDRRARQARVTAYGFYPDPDVSFARLVLMRSVPGIVQDELRTGQLTQVKCKLVVYVDRDQFRRASAVISRWRCQPTYRLLTRDCIEMTRAVAVEIGLQVPQRGGWRARPADYLRKLIEMN